MNTFRSFCHTNMTARFSDGRFVAFGQAPAVATSLGFVALVFIFGCLLPACWCPPALAAEGAKIDSFSIEVPAHSRPIAVTCPLPQNVQLPEGGARWADQGLAGSEPLQVVPAILPNGLPSERQQDLMLVAPPNSPEAAANQTARSYSLAALDQAPESSFRFFESEGATLRIEQSGKPVLAYNFGTITNEKVPLNEHRRSRACYVHPVWGLSGEVLTDDFPKDHYHHHGIFWTWPHVKIDGQQHDLWAGATIAQRFERWLVRRSGPVAAVVAVENGWYVGPKRVMRERVWIRVWRATETSRCVDFDLTFIPEDRPIELWGAEGKSYGGFTMRFKPGPRSETLITVPQGKTSEDLPDTPLAWADFTSKFDGATQRSGAAVFVPPHHPDFPPTWLTRYYGPLCVGWPGVKSKTFPPGEPIRLSYRVWIHRSAVEPEDLAAAYADYEAAAKVRAIAPAR